MNNRLARFLLVFVALWLPVQAMAALYVPFCGHARAQAGIAAEQSADAMPCHEAMASEPARQDGGDCDHCDTCHLAGAGFMPSAPVATGFVPADKHYASPAIVAPPSHVAEPPRHPPRSVA